MMMLRESRLWLLVVCVLMASNAAAQNCTDAQTAGLQTLLPITASFPAGTLNISLQIFNAFAPGLVSPYAPVYATGFDAVAAIFALLYNVTEANSNVSAITAVELGPVCAQYDAYMAENNPLISAFLQYSNLAAVYALLLDGVLNSLTPQPSGSNFTDQYYSANGPAAVRLALVPNGMVVSWQTQNSTQNSTVLYGKNSGSLDLSSSGTNHSYGTAFFHDVVLSNLSPNTTYYYSISGDASQTVYEFVSAPSAGSSFNVTIIGDMGITNAMATYTALLNSIDQMDLAIHIGDLSYADDYYLRPDFDKYDTYEQTWNIWQQWISQIASTVPYMTIPGNHEAECQLFVPYGACPKNQQNFTAYRNRFRMPSEESGAGPVQSMWYSFDYGLVHFTMIDTESDFPNGPEGNFTTTSLGGPFGGANGIPAQLDWLKADLALANANRNVTPWLIVMGHRPMYTAVSGLANTDGYRLQVPATFDPLLNEYNVDLYLSGHLHMYERLYPISNGVPVPQQGNVYMNPTAPTYIVNGAAGNDERHRAVPSYNYSLGAYYNNVDYGYGRLIAYNASYLQWQFVKAASGEVDEELWIVQNGREPSGVTSSSSSGTTSASTSSSNTGLSSSSSSSSSESVSSSSSSSLSQSLSSSSSSSSSESLSLSSSSTSSSSATAVTSSSLIGSSSTTQKVSDAVHVYVSSFFVALLLSVHFM